MPIHMATGLATGVACVGNMGSRDRFNYSAIGDVVNEAARAEQACRHVGYDVVATASMADEARGLAMLDAGTLSLKGIAQPVPVRLIVGDEALRAAPVFAELEAAHAALLDRLHAGAATRPDRHQAIASRSSRVAAARRRARCRAAIR